MKQYKVALLRKEFPFIDRLFVDYEGKTDLWPEAINEIKIRRGDNALLSKTGLDDFYYWRGGGHSDYTHFFAVWSQAEGEQILKLESACTTGNGSGGHYKRDANTIGEQLFVKGIVPKFIVECTQNDSDDNGNGHVTRFWTIYKMGRFDLSRYHQMQIDRAADALKAEIAAACADD